MDLIEIPREQLYVGLSLPYTLRDADGQILLVRDQLIETPGQLDALKGRGRVFVEIDQTEEGVRALMSGIDKMDRVGAPIKDFSKFLAQKRAREQGREPIPLHQRWEDLELRVAGSLASFDTLEAAQQRFYEIDQTLVALLIEDAALGQFLLFHRAVANFDGYSQHHALLCAALCCALAQSFDLPEAQRRSLSCAALSMNLAMTTLQNVLAQQKAPPNPAQRADIERHPHQSAHMLKAAGVDDVYWLELVDKHHAHLTGPDEFASWKPLPRLCKMLQVVDRYTAALSPRRSRSGRNARDTVRSIVSLEGVHHHDPVGAALVKLLGLAPPGTYVRLNSAETALVLRAGHKPAEPIVATLLNRLGDAIAEPRLFDTSRPPVKVEATLTAESVRVQLSPIVLRKLIERAALMQVQA